MEVLRKNLKAKKAAERAVYFTKRDAQTEQFTRISNNNDKNRTFKTAKRLKRDIVDVIDGKCIKNDDGKLTLTVDDKLKALQSHYQKFLNVDFPWNLLRI